MEETGMCWSLLCLDRNPYPSIKVLRANDAHAKVNVVCRQGDTLVAHEFVFELVVQKTSKKILKKYLTKKCGVCIMI